MTDLELEELITCDADSMPSEATFGQWAQRSGESIERVRAIYQSVCDKRRSQLAGSTEIDPTGDF